MLELKEITKDFGGKVLANDKVSISVKRGTIHAIVGENGAGKTTIMRIAYGFYTADSGSIYLDGKRVDIRSPHDAIALGIGMVHQHFMLVDNMTVAENIILGAEPGSAFDLDLDSARKKITSLSEQLHLEVNPDAVIEDLSVGQKQRVELVKVLFRDAEILILDEPTAVLSPQEVSELFTILRKMKERGKTIVIITHKLDEVMAISDEVTVMRDGKSIASLTTAETSVRELARLIVGRDVLLRVEKSQAKPGENVLEVKDLTVTNRHGYAINGVSFTIRSSEIVGIAGIDGNGQTELIECLAGLLPADSGQVIFEGRDITNLSPRAIKASGIAHIPEDRHKRGLLLNWNLAENSILGVHYREPFAAAGGFMSETEIGRHVEKIVNEYDVRPKNPAAIAKSLSGGNQQKLIIGREFEIEPKLLLVSQPTRGVDIGAIEFIHRKLIEMRDRGIAVLLVSAELEEVMALADRLLVIRDGRIVGEANPSTTSAEEIGLMMTGG